MPPRSLKVSCSLLSTVMLSTISSNSPLSNSTVGSYSSRMPFRSLRVASSWSSSSFVSIVLFSVRICPRRPEQGNAPSGHAFDLIGIPPLPGSLRGALIGCDGSRHFARTASTLGLSSTAARPQAVRKSVLLRFCLLLAARRSLRLRSISASVMGLVCGGILLSCIASPYLL